MSKFKEEVCCNPDTDFAPYAAEFRKLARERELSVIRMLFLELYGQEDILSLKIDLAKLELLGTAQATPFQRATLLRCLCGVVSLYIQGDLSKIIAMCEQDEDAYRMEADTPALG